MKRTTLLATAVLAASFAFAVTGCSTSPFGARSTAPRRASTYALVISVSGQAPTDEQFAALMAKFSPAFAARNLVLVADAALADQLIYVQYFPDPIDPTSGSAYVVGVIPNPSTYNLGRPRVASAGYSYTPYVGYGFYDTFSDYYGYYPNTYTDVSQGTTQSGIRPAHPPKHDDHPPGTDPKDRDHDGDRDHPPGTERKDHPPGQFAGSPPPHSRPEPGDPNPGQHFHHPPPPRPASEPAYSRNDSGYSRSDSGYSRSEPSSSSSYSSNNSSYSSSSSFVGPMPSSPSSNSNPVPTSSSISFSSSASSDSSSSSSSSYSSPAPSYSPPADSGSRDSSTNKQQN